MSNGNGKKPFSYGDAHVLKLEDYHIQWIHSIFGGLLDKPNAIKDMGQYPLDPDMLPDAQEKEATFLRVYYALAGDRAPTMLTEPGHQITVTSEEMLDALTVKWGKGPAEAYMAMLAPHKDAIGSIRGLAYGLHEWLEVSMRKHAFLAGSGEFDDSSITYEEAYARAMSRVNAVAPQSTTITEVLGEDGFDLWMEQTYKKRRELAAQDRSDGPTLPWGLSRKVATLKKNELCTFAAKSSMGKTTIALNLAHHIAHRQKGYDVVYFFLETRVESQYDRLISSRIFVTTQDLRDPRRGFDLLGSQAHEKRAFQLYQQEVAEYRHRQAENGRVWFVHCPGITTYELLAKVRLYKQLATATGRELVVIVDYYDLVSTEGLATVAYNATKHEHNNALGDWFKTNLAEQEELYVIVMAQDNMDADYRDHRRKTSGEGQRLYARSQVFIRVMREYADDDRPYIDQETGKQGYDSALRPMFWHEEGQPSSQVILQIEKGSDDATGPIMVQFLGPYFQITEVSKQELPPGV